MTQQQPMRGIWVVDLVVLLMSVGVVAVSMILAPGDAEVSLFGVDLPSICMWKNLTGWDCPGCGLTRSFTFMGHGDLSGAFDRHVLGPLMFVFVAAQIPWRLVKLVGVRFNRPGAGSTSPPDTGRNP